MDIETRQQFEAWAATYDLDLKPARCSMGEFQYCELNTDFAWQAWKIQANALEQTRERLAALEIENRILKSDAAKAFALRIADRRLIVRALRDAKCYRNLRAHPNMLLPSPDEACCVPDESLPPRGCTLVSRHRRKWKKTVKQDRRAWRRYANRWKAQRPSGWRSQLGRLIARCDHCIERYAAFFILP
jgi:hypothetical protein